METDRAPFVVKSAEGGAITREVPWRKATGVDSATRSQLLDLLVPVYKLPGIAVKGGTLKAEDRGGSRAWVATVRLYITPVTDERVVLPWDGARFALSVGGQEVENLPGTTEIKAPKFDDTLTKWSPGQAIVEGPGVLDLTATFKLSYEGEKLPAPEGDQHLRGALEVAGGATFPIKFEASFEPQRLQGFGGVYRLKR